MFAGPERRRALCFSWLVGTGTGTLAGWSWITGLPLGGPQAWLFAHAALVSTAATLALLPSVLLAALLLRAQRVPGEAWIQGAVWALFGLLLYADTRVFALFRYHFNGMI